MSPDPRYGSGVERLGRRALLRTTGAISIGLLAGCLGSSPSETIAVGVDGEPAFEPRTLEVTVDSLVEFVWESGGHTLVWESVPDTAEEFSEWDGVTEPEEEGFSHREEFIWEGTYEFICREHEDDMTGSIEIVVE